jgi:hypothetical protein
MYAKAVRNKHSDEQTLKAESQRRMTDLMQQRAEVQQKAEAQKKARPKMDEVDARMTAVRDTYNAMRKQYTEDDLKTDYEKNKARESRSNNEASESTTEVVTDNEASEEVMTDNSATDNEATKPDMLDLLARLPDPTSPAIRSDFNNRKAGKLDDDAPPLSSFQKN